MWDSAMLVAAAGLALGSAAFSVSASAGVLGAGGRADLRPASVITVGLRSKLGYDAETWHGFSRADRHALRLEWRQARHAAKKGDGSLMQALLTQHRGGGAFGAGAGSSGVSTLLSSLSTATISYTGYLRDYPPTPRQAGGLPGTNYLSLPSFHIRDFSAEINLSGATMTSWLEHSTRLAGFDAQGNVTFEPLKAGAHIIAVEAGTNVESISVDPDTNALTFKLKAGLNGVFNYTLQFADGTTRVVKNNPIWKNFDRVYGRNFVNKVTTRSFSIPFAEILRNFTNFNHAKEWSIFVALKDNVTDVVVDELGQVVTGKLKDGKDLGRISITASDGHAADTVTKTIQLVASPK